MILKVLAAITFLSCVMSHSAVLEVPAFNRSSGVVPTGFAFRLTNSNPSGAVMFTVDGVDPRSFDGSVYTNAHAFRQPVTVNRTLTAKARVLSGYDWSDLAEATFVASNDYTKLLITEVMYQPPGTNGAHERSREFLEIKNAGSEVLDISGVTVQGFSFPTQTVILPGEFKVLVQNTNAYLQDHPGALVSGAYPLRLQNGDSEVYMFHASGAVLFSMTYKTHPPWPTVPDDHNFTEKGFSLVTVEPNSIQSPYHFRSWRASSFQGGSPGADDPPDMRPYIKVTEVLARPGPFGYPHEAVEFYNPYPTNVDIGGSFLSDSRPQPKRYQIPPNTVVPANGFFVLDDRQFGGTLGFSSAGEGVYLFSATNGSLTGYSTGLAFTGVEQGMSYGPVINSVGDEFFVPISSQTLGISNSAPVVGPIVVTEFNYHWSSNGTGLFLEFVNITDEWIPLFDLQNPQNTWQLYAGPMFFLPQDTLIPPRAIFLVVAEDPESFRAKHAVPEEVPIFGRLTYDEHYLTAYGIHLFRPSGVINVPGYTGPRMIPVESINFERQFPWPSAADGAGWSLQRLATHEFANDPKNWRATPEMSPGRPNFAFPIDGWRAWHFSRSELGDPAVSGDEADPDNDGLNNLSEYAFGLDPKSPGKLPVRVGITQGRLTVAVAKYGGATDVDVFAESAGSLSGPWSSGDVESEMIWPDLIMWDRTQNASSRFLRIRVRRQ